MEIVGNFFYSSFGIGHFWAGLLPRIKPFYTQLIVMVSEGLNAASSLGVFLNVSSSWRMRLGIGVAALAVWMLLDRTYADEDVIAKADWEVTAADSTSFETLSTSLEAKTDAQEFPTQDLNVRVSCMGKRQLEVIRRTDGRVFILYENRETSETSHPEDFRHFLGFCMDDYFADAVKSETDYENFKIIRALVLSPLHMHPEADGNALASVKHLQVLDRSNATAAAASSPIFTATLQSEFAELPVRTYGLVTYEQPVLRSSR